MTPLLALLALVPLCRVFIVLGSMHRYLHSNAAESLCVLAQIPLPPLAQGCPVQSAPWIALSLLRGSRTN